MSHLETINIDFNANLNPPNETKIICHILLLSILIISVKFSGKITITKTHLFKYIENFTTKKSESFQIKIWVFFFIFLLKNIDCGYSLEPPHRGGWRGGSNEYLQSMFLGRYKKIMYTPVNPSFTI